MELCALEQRPAELAFLAPSAHTPVSDQDFPASGMQEAAEQLVPEPASAVWQQAAGQRQAAGAGKHPSIVVYPVIPDHHGSELASLPAMAASAEPVARQASPEPAAPNSLVTGEELEGSAVESRRSGTVTDSMDVTVGRTSSAGQARQQQPADELMLALSDPDFVQLAETNNIFWVKLRGYPHWPAQKVSEKDAPALLASAPLKKGAFGVQFFGTNQVAWVTPEETSNWGEGIRRNYYGREKKQKKYKLAMKQVLDFLVVGKTRHAPDGWWTRPPRQPKKKADQADGDADVSSPARAVQAPLGDAAPSASQDVSAEGTPHMAAIAPSTLDFASAEPGAAALSTDAGLHTSRKSGRATAGVHTQRTDGIDEEALLDLAEEAGAEAVQAQAEPTKAPRPQYENIRRNIWISRARPKRLPLDEMETCNCSVIRGEPASLLSIPASTA
ncbi:hypothetical protein WJX73_000630 [Symbiochloris irregularis]|uniref:PWWP domain-containing protein n=1 Tax=Symbiochloris irregularis TaxID=706552 RepID=A0AAW1NLH8_9CHLO